MMVRTDNFLRLIPSHCQSAIATWKWCERLHNTCPVDGGERMSEVNVRFPDQTDQAFRGSSRFILLVPCNNFLEPWEILLSKGLIIKQARDDSDAMYSEPLPTIANDVFL